MPTKKKAVNPGPKPNQREFLKRSAVGSVGALFSTQIAISKPLGGQTELQKGWKIISVRQVSARDEDVSKSSFDTVTPEQTLPNIDGVELVGSWVHWINWKYIGYQDPKRHIDSEGPVAGHRPCSFRPASL